MARPPSPLSIPGVSTSPDHLPRLPPSRTPSPPLLTIRLVSPPTPRTSLSPAHDDLQARPNTEYTHLDVIGEHPTPLSEGFDRGESFPFSFNPTLGGTSTNTRTRTTSLRSSLSSTFHFPTLFSSSTSTSNSELSSSTSSFSRPFSSLSQCSSRHFKTRTPSLGGNHKKTNVGMVKNAMGLARRVSMNVKGRIGGKGKEMRGSQVLRRIEEDEFPYVGELSLARRGRQRQRRRSSQAGFAKSPQTGRRTSSLFGSPSFATVGDTSLTRKPRRTISPPHKASPRSRPPRKVNQKARVSFVPPSSTSVKRMIDRPRPISRNSERPTSSFEEGEWSEEEVELFIPPPHESTSSRSSAKPFFRRFSLIRSRAPTPPAPRSPPSPSEHSNPSSSPKSQPTFTISHEHHTSDESFYCRGEFPVTPSSTRSPTQSNRLYASTSTRGGSWFSSPRNAVYIPRFEGTGENYSPFSLTGSIKRKEPEKRRQSLSPGDLTRYLEELLIEQGGSIDEVLERSNGEEDIFADAEEEDEGGIGKKEMDPEFELSTESDRTMRSTRTFTLSLPPPGQHSLTPLSADSSSADSPTLPTSPLPQSSASSLDPFSLSLPTDPISSETSSTSSNDDNFEPEPIVLSASRQIFTRGQLARKHSLAQLVLHRSPSSSSSSSPTSPRSPLSPLSENTLFATKQQARSVSYHHFRKSSKGLIPHTAPLPNTSFESPLSINIKENYVTAPSTPSAPASTSSDCSETRREERRRRAEKGRGKGRREEMLPVEIWEDLRGRDDGKRRQEKGEEGPWEAREEAGRREEDEARRREGRPSC